jgi:hypothetical protein
VLTQSSRATAGKACVHGSKGIAGECLTPVLSPLRGESDGIDGTLRGPPAQMFIYSFIYSWAGQPIETGVAFPVDNFAIEYWFSLSLEPLSDEEDDLSCYVRSLQQLWFE